jgi:hypothetical protein
MECDHPTPRFFNRLSDRPRQATDSPQFPIVPHSRSLLDAELHSAARPMVDGFKRCFSGQTSKGHVVNDSTKPDWWHKARELEKADQLEAAETVLKDAIPHQAFALEIAELYRERMVRFLALNDHTRAAEARQQSSDWAHFYASQATSGGEGTAMSRERDAFLATLGPRPGH